MRRLLKWLSRYFRHYRSSSDLAEEMQVHTSMEAEEMMERGLPQSEARRRAVHRTGQVSSAVESVSDQEFMTMLKSFWQDFRIGLRSLTKNPVFTVIAILTLAIGIGASTAIVSLLYGLLLRSLPVPKADRLARVELLRSDKNLQQSGAYIPYGLFDAFRQRQRSFEELAAISEYPVSMQDREGTQRFYSSFFVSGNFFSALRVQPHRGRLLSSGDDIRGGPAAGWPIVLRYGFWMNQFKGDAQALGKQLRIGDRMMTIIGITPPAFHGLWNGVEPQLYAPLQCINVMVGSDVLNQPQSIFSVSAIGRLKSNVSIKTAGQELSQLKPELLRQAIPIATQTSPGFRAISLNIASASGGFPSYLGKMFAQPLYIMQGLTCVVLLLCCVNVGGLLMSKLYTRQRDFAIRTAVGAGRWRLTRQYLTESLLIALGGILLGGSVAWYTSPLLLHYFRTPMMSQDLAIEPDFRMFLPSGLCCLGTTLMFGALPAWRAGRADVGTLMKSRTAVGEQRGRANGVFVPVQIGIALTLVALAAMLSQTLGKLRGERTGFDVSHVTIQTAPLIFSKGKLIFVCSFIVEWWND